MTRWLLFCGALGLSGCGASLGELCSVDQDCRTGLRCSARDGGRGVCVYAVAPLVDIGAADRARLDGPPADRWPSADRGGELREARAADRGD